MGIVGWQDQDGNLHDGTPSERDLARQDVAALRAVINTRDGPRHTTIMGPIPDSAPLDADGEFDQGELDRWADDWYSGNYGTNPAYGGGVVPPSPTAPTGRPGATTGADLGLGEFEE